LDIRFCGAMSEIDVLPMYVLFECFFCCGLGQAWHTSPAEYTWYTCTHTVIHSVHYYVCGVALVASTAVCYTQPGAYDASAPAPEAELSFWHKRVKDIFVVEAWTVSGVVCQACLWVFDCSAWQCLCMPGFILVRGFWSCGSGVCTALLAPAWCCRVKTALTASTTDAPASQVFALTSREAPLAVPCRACLPTGLALRGCGV
jgi:hypothetical protein